MNVVLDLTNIYPLIQYLVDAVSFASGLLVALIFAVSFRA